MAIKNSIKYLETLSNQSQMVNYAVLKSYFGEKVHLLKKNDSDEVAEEQSTDLPSKCDRCFVDFVHSRSNFVIKPEKKKSNFARKMLKKAVSGQVLTKFQTKYLEKLDPVTQNSLEIKCKVCGHLKRIRMKKPKVVKEKQVDDSKVIVKKRKRQKRRDKFCGLSESAVLSAQQKIETPFSNKISDLKNNSSNAQNKIVMKDKINAEPARPPKKPEAPNNKAKCKFPYVQANLPNDLKSSSTSSLTSINKKAKRKHKKQGIVTDCMISALKASEKVSVPQKIIIETPKNKILDQSLKRDSAKKNKRKNKLNKLINTSNSAEENTSSSLKKFLSTL